MQTAWRSGGRHLSRPVRIDIDPDLFTDWLRQARDLETR
jgi:hypothetical protein